MSRSSKKKPFVEERLLKKIEAMNENGSKEVLKTWSRASTIYPQMVGHLLLQEHLKVMQETKQLKLENKLMRKISC